MGQKAPGKSYRNGLTLLDLMKLFPNDEVAEKWFSGLRWGDDPWCPYCGSVNVLSGAKHKTMPYRCRDCRKRFSVRTCTAMEGSNLGFQTWALAIYLLTTSLKGVSSMKLHRDLGITQKSAWHLAHRLRKAYEEDRDPMDGPVEVDETYIGGKNANKHWDKKIKNANGTVGKTPVIGVKDRKTNKVRARVIERPNQPTLEGFIEKRVKLDTKVYTDEHSGYNNVPNREVVKHSVGEYVRDQAHTNGIESFWSMLKRGYVGTYHKMSVKHLGRYVNEFAGRHNLRPLDTITQMEEIARGMVGKRLKYSRLTA